MNVTKDGIDITNVVNFHRRYHHKVIWYVRKLRKERECHSGPEETTVVTIPGMDSRIGDHQESKGA